MMKNTINVDTTRIGVVGAGSWGTAIADLLASRGFQVHLWVFEKDVRKQIQDQRENNIFLPGFRLSENIVPSNDLAEVVFRKDLLVLVVPSHLMREVTLDMQNMISEKTIIVTASKGIENETLLTMTGVLRETLPQIPDQNVTALSGPSFAKEVARRVPTAVVVGGMNPEIAAYVQHVFSTPHFRVYTNDDRIGLELGGAVKNVIAIAAGIVDGMGLGLNSRAAMITRGLAEIRRLGLKLGAKYNTFAGLSGVGDLILTCTGDLSRNHTVGKKIGEGRTLKEILSEMRMVAEGVKTAKSVYNLARKLQVEVPICNEVYHVLYDDFSPEEAVYRLMTRELKSEEDQ
jgi:glycerol-3-phosphate dehydrogenase (NAD(P)+)